MCHESTSVALAETIGIGKATVTYDDFLQAELIIIMGQNPGTNHPRMLTALEKAKHNGAKIVAINPMPEAGLMRFKNPQRSKRNRRQGHPAGRPLSAHPARRRHGTPAGGVEARPGSRGPRARDSPGPALPRHQDPRAARPRGALGSAGRSRRPGGHRAEQRADRRSHRDVRRLAAHDRLLGHGSDPAQGGSRDDPRDRESAGAAWQHRQARRRPRPDPRSQQRPGRPDDGHLGEASPGLPRCA